MSRQLELFLRKSDEDILKDTREFADWARKNIVPEVHQIITNSGVWDVSMTGRDIVFKKDGVEVRVSKNP